MENNYNVFKKEVESLIANAKTKTDLSVIGAKFNEAIDNNYNAGFIWDLQVQAAKKMTEIYNKPKESGVMKSCSGLERRS